MDQHCANCAHWDDAVVPDESKGWCTLRCLLTQKTHGCESWEDPDEKKQGTGYKIPNRRV